MVAIVCCQVSLFAQERFAFQQLDNSSGLSNSCLNDAFMDADNLLWLGTWDGLNVYDGSSFHIFNYVQGSPQKSLGSNIVYQLAQSSTTKDIWMATIEGVSRYNSKEGLFKHFFYRAKQDSMGVAKGYLVAAGKAGSIYATAKASSTLYFFNPAKDTFQTCSFNVPSGKIIKLLVDANGLVWILEQGGSLKAYAANTGSFELKASFTGHSPITNCFAVNGRIFYTTAQKTLHAIDASLQASLKAHLPYDIRAISFYNGNYLLAWSSKGMAAYTQDFQLNNALLPAVPNLANMRVTCILLGKQEQLWLGTDGNGIIKVAKQQNHFGTVNKWPDGYQINIPIRAFNEVNGALWVGTKGNGIVQVNHFGTGKASSSILESFQTASDLLNNCVYSITKGKEGYVYVGSDAAGITIYDMARKKWYDWKSIANNNQYPSFSSVHSILVDKDSSVWMGLESYGLMHLKLGKQPNGQPYIQYLRSYPHTGSNTGPANNVIYALADGNADEVLIGCRYGGLSIFNKTTKTFRTFTASYEGSISNNDVLSLYKDSKQRIWIGTSFGLNYIDLMNLSQGKPTFSQLNTTNGLPSNTVHAITEDGNGNIWASTNKGLFKLLPQTMDVVRFRQSDGLQSNEFSDGAVWKNPEGHLFFGGVYGFNYFNPDSIKTNQPLSNLLVSNFQISGSSLSRNILKVIPAERSHGADVFSIARDGNYFELTIKAINYSTVEKCQYAYKLEGSDREWRLTADDGKIAYNNIPPGNYKLKIKWSNGDGKWTTEVVAMQLNVRQYFWLTLPAFLLYAVVLFTAWYVFYIYRKDKTEMRHKLELEMQLRHKDEEVLKGQQHFFTNITHELQTPLTLIMGGLERFQHKNRNNRNVGDKELISLVHQQASRLSYLAHQLLEFRRAEEGFVSNHYSYFNASTLISNIAALFDRHEESKQLSFALSVQPNIELWTDKDKLEKVVFNLLSNAFKHTGNGEKIVLQVMADETTGNLKMVMANSGVQLSQKELDRLFEQFFVANETRATKMGTGIGLAFTKELVGLLNGQISVDCKDGWISFTLLLPLRFVPDNVDMVKGNNTARQEQPSSMIQHIAKEAFLGKPAEESNKQSLIEALQPNERKTILVADDEPAIRFLLRDVLAEQYLVYEAESGKQAMELVKNILPNLIISDVMMPDMDGLELCARIKNIPETCHIPVVLLTAKGTLVQKTEGYDAGADAYIPKPFNLEHLLVRVRKLLEYRQKMHGLFAQEQGAANFQEESMKEEDKQFLGRIYQLVEEQLDNTELDAAFLEKELALSRMQLYRKLKSLTDMPPNEFIRHIRLQKAAQLLKTTKLSVAEIFYQTGFNNQSYFFREFKKIFNCSPNEYRQQHQVPSN